MRKEPEQVWADQFDAARADIRRMKKTTPHVFHEWQRLEAAKEGVRKAYAELTAAKAAWERLGE